MNINDLEKANGLKSRYDKVMKKIAVVKKAGAGGDQVSVMIGTLNFQITGGRRLDFLNDVRNHLEEERQDFEDQLTDMGVDVHADEFGNEGGL